MRKLTTLIVALLVGLSFAQQDNLDATLLEGLAANEEFSTLVGLVDQAGLVEALSGAGPFTLFAPANGVFEELNPDILAQLNDNPDLLRSVLLSHVVEGAYGILDLRNAPEGSIVSLNGDPLEIDLDAGGLKINGADLVSTDVENTYANGVLNQVDDLVLSDSLLSQLGITEPEEATSDPGVFGGTYADYDVNADGVLTEDEVNAGLYTRYDANADGIIDQTEYDAYPGLFGGAFADYDLDASGDLSQDEYRTAYADSGVFDSLDADASGDISQEEYDANRDLLGVGAVPGAAVTDATMTDAAMTDTNAFGNYDADADGLLTRDEYNNALYTRYDTNADGVIDQAEYDTDPGLFGGAFADYDLDASGDLNEDEYRTAFDSNSVFDSLDTDGTGDINQQEYDANPDLLGLGATGAAVTGATATVVGTEASGAQMFDGTVVELLTNDGRFGTLLTAVTDAGLLESLQQQAPFTLFAPTDDAFAALPDAERETILGDTDMLSNLLLYHVVSGEVMAEDLVGTEPGNASSDATAREGQAATLEGTDIALMAGADGTVTVNDGQATVTEADLQASDGVVHVIDAVLIPASMMNQ